MLVGFILLLIKSFMDGRSCSTLRFARTETMAVGRLICSGRLPGHHSAARLLVLPDHLRFAPGKTVDDNALPSLLFVVFGTSLPHQFSKRSFSEDFFFTALTDLCGAESPYRLQRCYSPAFTCRSCAVTGPRVFVIFLVGFVLTLVRYRSDSADPFCDHVTRHTTAMIFGISAHRHSA